MKESIKKNYVYSLINQIMTIAIPVITTPFVARTLGAQAIGDFNYTTGIVSYFCMLALLGTANYGQREIAKRHSDRQKIGELFRELLLLRVVCIGIVLLAYCVFMNLAYWEEYKILFSVQLISFVAWGMDITWLYQGLEKFRVIAIRNLIIKVVATFFIFLVIRTPRDLVMYTFVYCFSDLIGNISMWFQRKQYVGKYQKISMRGIISHLKGCLELFLPNIALQLYTVFDKTVLGTLVNTLQVGYYSQAEKIITILVTSICSLFTVLFPRFSYLSASGQNKQAEIYYRKALDYTFILSLPMLTGMLIVSRYFVPFFLGDGYEQVIPIMQILSVLLVVMSITKLHGILLMAYDKQNDYTISLSIAAGVNILLNIGFIKLLNMYACGVAIASVISEIVAMLIQIFYLPREFSARQLIKSFFRYLKPTILMAIVILAFDFAVSSTYIIKLVVEIILGGGTYSMCLLLGKDELCWGMLHDILKR